MAGSTTGIRAGLAFVELELKDKVSAGLANAQRKLRGFASQVNKLGRIMAVSATLIAVPLALSAKTFADYQQSMARVLALTNSSQREFKELGDQAQDLGRQTVYSAKQAADAMGFFALAGFKVNTILKAMGPTLDLAAAGQLDIAEAADITAKIMASMKIRAEDLGHATDVLTKAFTTANTDLLQLGDAMKFVGPIASQAGYGIEQTAAAIQILSNAGIQAQLAGTSLRGILLSLVNPSADAQAAMDELGVSVLDRVGNVRDLADIVDDFNRKLKRVGGGEKLRQIGRIFDTRQAAAFAELAARGGDELRKFTGALKDSEGTAKRIADIQLDTLKGDVIILASAFEGLKIAVGGAIEGPIRSITKRVTQLVNYLTRLVDENRAVIVTALKLGLAFAGAAVSLFAIGAGVNVLAFALGGLGVIAKAALAAFTTLKVAMFLLNPVSLAVIGAVLAIGFAMSQNANLVRDAAGVIGSALASLGEFVAPLGQFFAAAFRPVFDTLRTVGETAKRTFQGIRDALAAGDLKLAVAVLWAGVKLAWQQGTSEIEAMWIGFTDEIDRQALELVFKVRRHFVEFVAGIKSALALASGAFKSFWNNTSGDARETFNLIELMRQKAINATAKLLNPDFDQEAADRQAEGDFTKAQHAAQNQRDESNKEIKKEKATRLGEIDKEERTKLGALEQARIIAQRTRENGTNGNLDAAVAELEAAQSEFNNAVAAAKFDRRKVETIAANKDTQIGPPALDTSALDKLKTNLAGIGESVKAQAARVTVQGTFSSRVAGNIGAARAADRTAKATESTARHTKDIIRELRNAAGPAFA